MNWTNKTGWVVYLLKCKDETIYTGSTNDLEKRLQLHNQGKGAKYTKGRGPLTLLKYIKCNNKSSALKLEYQIKQLSRKEKLNLIAIKERAIELLQNTRQAPQMFCRSRESLMMRVMSILEMENQSFNARQFMLKHIPTQGNSYLTLDEDITLDWAHQVIDDAINLLKII